MPSLKVALELDAVDLASPQIRRVIQSVERLQQATERLRQQQTGQGGAGASGMVRLSRDTQQASQSLGTFGSIVQQAIGVAGGIELADVVSTIAQGLLQVGVAAINANASLQRMQTTLRTFVRDPATADAMTAMLRSNADVTPFGTQEVMAAGAQLVPIAQTTRDLERAVRLAEQLAVLNPEQGLQGAAFALREAEAGDYVSLQTRFNIQRSLINHLKGEGLSGLNLTTEALKRMGVTWDLVSAQGATFEGRASTITSALQELARVAAAPSFDVLTERQRRAVETLDANRPASTRVAQAAGGIFADLLGGGLDAQESQLQTVLTGVEEIIALVDTFRQHVQGLPSLLDAIIPPEDRAALLGPLAGLGRLLQGPLAGAEALLGDLGSGALAEWRRWVELDAQFYGTGRTTVSTLLATGGQRAGERSSVDYAATQRALSAANWTRLVQNVQALQRGGERAPGSEAEAYVAALRRGMADQEDAITRHTGLWRSTANAIIDATQKVQMYDDRLKGLNARGGVLGSLLDPLLAYRSQALRTGTFTGQTAVDINAAILQIKTLQAANVKDTGLAALADFLARTYDQQVGGSFFGTEEMTVTATNVVVNGPSSGPSAAAQAASGVAFPDMISRRYANSRIGWPEGPGLGGVLHR